MPRTADGPSQIDIDVGSRIRVRRKLLGLSQSRLADALGITFQQVQKYEKGSNRVSSSELQAISQILGTTPSALFGEEGPSSDRIPEISDIELHIGSAEGLALNKAFVAIKDDRIRRSIIGLVKVLAEETGSGVMQG